VNRKNPIIPFLFVAGAAFAISGAFMAWTTNPENKNYIDLSLRLVIGGGITIACLGNFLLFPIRRFMDKHWKRWPKSERYRTLFH
jgi:hypothetical protein